jgi:GntR family transcriptional regulator
MARILLYQAVAAALREEIEAEGYGPGALLPSEGALASKFAVSRETVRRALEELKAAGHIDSRQGFGWYLVASPLRQSLDALRSVDAQFLAAGRRPERRLLSFAFAECEGRPAQSLGTSRLLVISRLNLADGEPISRNTAWVPEDLALDLSRLDVERHSLHDLLGVELGGAEQVISAVAASADDAGLLGLPVGSPLLRAERTTRSVAGRPVLFSEAVHNPLVTEFAVDLPAAAVDAPGLRLVSQA